MKGKTVDEGVKQVPPMGRLTLSGSQCKRQAIKRTENRTFFSKLMKPGTG